MAQKQSKYPLLFLTQGLTEKWPAYHDPRTRSVEMATYFAISMGLTGINIHAEDLLKNRSLISFVKSKDLVLFVWGDDLNDKNLIRQLKSEGVDGVVYDKVDEYSEPVYVSIPNGTTDDERKTLMMGIMTGSGSACSVNSPQSGFSSWESSGLSTASTSP